MQYRILALSRSRHCEQLAKSKVSGRLVVWWYGGIETRRRDDVVPLVVVFFRRLNDDNTPGYFIRKSLGLPLLGLLRLGSVWEDGACVGVLEPVGAETETFKIQQGQSGWRFVSFADAAAHGQQSPFAKANYDLRYERDRSWLLDFRLADAKRLLIPCLEYYTRCYGRSSEVRRVLATYRWEDAQTRLFSAAPLATAVPPDTWPVHLAKNMRNADAVFLAHVRHEDYAQVSARSIYAQCEGSFGTHEQHAFLKVRPWFTGSAQIKVDGLWVSETTFLGLRIRGGSEPDGKRILSFRDHDELVDDPSVPEGLQDSAARPTRVLKHPHDVVGVTDTQEADRDGATVEIFEDEYRVLGTPRVVINRRQETGQRSKQASTGAPAAADAEGPSAFSVGERHGKGKNIGAASIRPPVELECEGAVFDMWKALNYFARAHPDVIRSAEWFTFEDGFRNADAPHLIGLPPYDTRGEEGKTRLRRWGYHDPIKKIMRGILVARVSAQHVPPVYIVEIQRRSYVRKSKPPAGLRPHRKPTEYIEENFQGLGFTLADGTPIEPWLRELVAQIRDTEGIMKKIRSVPGAHVFTFNHATANGEVRCCEAAAKNALGKAGIHL